MWDKKLIDKGKHPENKDIVFRFEYSGENKIKSVRGSCGCTTVDVNDNVVSGYIKPKKIDEVVPSMITKREYMNEQVITVVFEDNTVQTLNVKAKIVPVNE